MPQSRHIKPERYNPVLKAPKKVSFSGWKDIPISSISFGTTMVFPTGGWRSARPLYEDRLPPCTMACPAGCNIEQYMVLAAQGRTEEAIALLRRDNPMPATTGRVCFHPCEGECNRREFDNAVQIQAVERYLGDKALTIPIEPEAKQSGKRVAVIGSGPAGLSFAYQALLAGIKPVVFEREEVPGGILSTGIPEYRLPKHVLAEEIGLLQQAGIEIRLGADVGGDTAFADLLKEFDAVFGATGYHRPRELNIPGEDAEGIMAGLAFLYDVNFHRPTPIGRKVIVVGGGNTAMDAARSALRLGAQVTVVYRRTREMMPAIREEVEEAETEGVRFMYLRQPVEILTGNGRVAGIRCRRMELGEPDESGRRRPVPVSGTETDIDCDTIIFATGEAPDLSYLPEDLEMASNGMLLDEKGEPVPGVLLGGDLTASRNTVAHAIGSGKRAFQMIEAYLTGRDWRDAAGILITGTHSFGLEETLADRPHSPEVVKPDRINLTAFEKCEMHSPPRLGGEAAFHGFQETTATLKDEAAVEEAARCFNCGVCNMCLRCFAYCPDSAVRPRPDGQGFDIDYEYCKGCGICVEECPRGAMTMVWEEK